MREEFNKEFSNYWRELKINANRLCNNETDAQDLLQETMMKAWRYRDKFEMGTNMRAWLYTIMRNQFINSYRRNIRFHEIIKEKGSFLAQKNPEPSASVRVASLSEYEFLASKLRKHLGDDFFEVLILVDVHDQRYDEAAEELNIPIGTVMSRLYRARKKSRAFLLKNYDRTLLLEAVPAEVVEEAEAA